MRVQNGMLFAWLMADFGERYVVSMYYCYSYNNGPYLAYMWRVPECVKVGRVVICMHTCALEGTEVAVRRTRCVEGHSRNG